MSWWHADIWSHPGHYLVDPYTWPWPPNNQDHIWPWKFKYQVHGHGQTHWSRLRPTVLIDMLLFVSRQLDIFWQRYSQFHSWPRKSKVKVVTKVKPKGHIWGLEVNHFWPWKFKVKVMAKVRPDGHIWGLEFSRCVCFSFRGNRTIFGWDIANSIFDLENSRSRSQQKSPKI